MIGSLPPGREPRSVAAAGFAAALAACAGHDGAGTDSAPAPDPSYADLAPTWEERCGACHLHGFASGGFSFDGGVDDLIGIASRAGMVYVEPGAPDGSYLWHKIAGTHLDAGGFGARMPIGPPLDDATLSDVEQWIITGALP